MPREANAFAIETILRSWLDDHELTLFCGDWRQGGLMELIPRGGALLTARHYDPPFDGLRELRLRDSAHHIHLDLGRLTKARYTVAPSVCFGFRPSFELRLASDDDLSRGGFGLGVSLNQPYAGTSLRAEPVRRYLRRAADHLRSFPGVVEVVCDHGGFDIGTLAAWAGVAELLAEFDEYADSPLPALRLSLERAAAAVPA